MRFFGNCYELRGGVSLAPKTLFETRPLLSSELSEVLLRSNIKYDYNGPGIRALSGAEYNFNKVTFNCCDIISNPPESAILRGDYVQFVKSDFKRIISKEAKFNIETQVGDNKLGRLEIIKNEDVLSVNWENLDIGKGQSLLRNISKSDKSLLKEALLEEPTVEMLLESSDELYLVKQNSSEFFLELAPERQPTSEIEAGWTARTCDISGVCNINHKWLETHVYI